MALLFTLLVAIAVIGFIILACVVSAQHKYCDCGCYHEANDGLCVVCRKPCGPDTMMKLKGDLSATAPKHHSLAPKQVELDEKTIELNDEFDW